VTQVQRRDALKDDPFAGSSSAAVPPAVPMRADDGKRDVLAVTPRASGPSTATSMFCILFCTRPLGRHHVLDFRGADAVRKAGEGAMGCCVRSPHTTVMPAGQGRHPASGPMTCTMPWRLSRKGKYALAPYSRMFASSRFDLQARYRVLDALVPVGGGRVVIAVGHDRIDTPGLAPGKPQALRMPAGWSLSCTRWRSI